MKKQLVLFILLFCCFSCASQKKEIIAKSIIKLEGRNTNIRDLIEIDGYWHPIPNYLQYNNNRMFFENGTWVNFHLKMDLSEDEIKANMSKSVKSWIKDNQIRWGAYWGVYTINNDTIIVHSYDKGSLWVGWSLREIRYKIIDRTTIQAIYSKSLLKRDETYYRDMNVSAWINGDYLYFTPADSLPYSDNWLKEERWIWRNEQDWKDYMQRIEQNKIKKT